ncbi:MAG: TOBE domain-containing protein [Methylomonas sp.]|jgi:molybdate transport system regulatory protein
MQKKHRSSPGQAWLEGEIRLAGALDSRMINLLKAIDQNGSINQAAKLLNLSYKGAWQIIERANNISPKVLISTAIGGSKGGGTSLTAAGRSLLRLFTELDEEHKAFLRQINQRLENDPETLLLLKPLKIKTSATNQLFGSVDSILTGQINVEVSVLLKGGEHITAALTKAELDQLSVAIGGDVLLLINSADIVLLTDMQSRKFSARNCLQGEIIRIVEDDVESEVVIRLPGGESIVAIITLSSARALELQTRRLVYAVFNSNAVLLAATENKTENP